MNKRIRLYLAVGLLLAVLVAHQLLFVPSSPKVSVPTGEWALTEAAWPICVSRWALDQYLSFEDSHDYDAARKLVDKGDCDLTSEGVRVFVEGTADWGRLSEVRPQGELATYWTEREALRPEAD